MRADQLLVERGLAASRSMAVRLIAGGVRWRATPQSDAWRDVTKSGQDLPNGAELALQDGAEARYVSRGGLKLETALQKSGFSVQGLRCLDVGQSTGGFTDCALQAGAARATCVDVGHGQLHEKLRRDPRVTSLEKTNARTLAVGILPRTSYDAVVMDLSFISLKSVLPVVWPFLRSGGILIALVKPQFEAGKAEVDRGSGVIRDDAVRNRVFADVRDFALRELPGAEVHGEMECPVHGADGNREYLLGLRRV